MAQEEVKFDVDFAPFAAYEPYAGEGGSDFIPEDGMFQVKITAAKPYFSKADAASGKKAAPMLRVHCTIEDDEKYNGMRLISHVHCGGEDRNGESMARQLMALLLSSETPLANIHANGTQKVKAGIDAIIQKLIGRTAWCEVVADNYKGQDTSKVDNWIEDKPRERYTQAKTVGGHRRKRRTVGTAPGQAVAGFNLGGTPAPAANGAPAATGAAAPATGTSPML